MRRAGCRPSPNWKILASGYVPLFLHEKGRLEGGDLPFAEVQRRALVNARAQAADTAADFSRRIRAASPAAPARTTGGNPG